jgi:hypothetical protein
MVLCQNESKDSVDAGAHPSLVVVKALDPSDEHWVLAEGLMADHYLETFLVPKMVDPNREDVCPSSLVDRPGRQYFETVHG